MMFKALALSLSIFGLLLLRLPTAIAAPIDCDNPPDTKTALKCGTDKGAGVPAPADPGNSLEDTIATGINIASTVIAILAVIMIIIGGARFVASAGNDQAIAGARKTITYAIIGLVVVALAQILVHFVLYNITNSTTNQTTGGTTNPPAQTSPRATGAQVAE